MGAIQPNQILKRLLISEKSTYLSSERNCYVFEVATDVSKVQIKAAVEVAWNVRVDAVRIQSRQCVSVRRAGKLGYTAAKKRALVTLHSEDRLSFY